MHIHIHIYGVVLHYGSLISKWEKIGQKKGTYRYALHNSQFYYDYMRFM